jgi:hypothetical protein
MGGTALRGVINAFAKQTPKARAAMKSLGFSAKEMDAGVHEPISALGKLGEALEGATEAKKLHALQAIFGAPASAGAAALMDAVSAKGDDGQTAMERARKATGNSKGALQRAADILGGDTQGKIKKFQAGVTAVTTELGETLAPTLIEVTTKAGELVKSFGQFAKDNPGTVGAIGKVTFGLTGMLAVTKTITLALGAGAPLWAGIVKGSGFAVDGVKGLAKAAQFAGAETAGLFTKSQRAADAMGKLYGAGAAFAVGWQVGGAIDSVIGQLFDLRGGLLSTEAALRMGESAGTTTPLDPTDATDGPEFERVRNEQNERYQRILDALIPGHAGNRKRNEDEAAAKPPVNGSPGVPGGGPFSAVPQGQFNAITGQLEIIVSDDRIKTKIKGKGMRVGEQEVR